jgi:preprotein translocase subunit SecB
MAENQANGDAAAAESKAPRLAVLTQYVKDLSFENPRAPRSLVPGAPRPDVRMRVDVGAQPMGDNHYEVTLSLNIDAKAGEDAVFVVELTYGGVFMVANVPPEALQSVLLIQCPSLLFPFARRIISDATRDGGFLPLNIDPIDFIALFQRRVQQQQQQAAAPGGPSSALS